MRNSNWIVAAVVIALTAPAWGVDCTQAHLLKACTVTIDAEKMLLPGPITVESGTKVTIKVKGKYPIEAVQFTLNRTPAAPPENPLSDLIALFTAQGIPGGLAAAHTAAIARQAEAESVSPPKKAGPEDLATQSAVQEARLKLAALEARLNLAAKTLDNYQETYKGLLDQTSNIAPCTTGKIDVSACKSTIDGLVTQIRAAIDKGVPVFSDESVDLKKIDEFILKNGLAGEVALMSRRDSDAALMEAERFEAGVLKKAQASLKSLAASLKTAAANASAEVSYEVPADRSTDTTVNITIDPSGANVQVPVLIHFQNWSWATMSAGVAITSFRRYSYSVNPHYNSASSDPAAALNYSIDEQIATRQIIPISYVNFQAPFMSWRCAGYDIEPTASIGAGVNVSTQSAEFAVGPGLRIGRIQFVLGVHWARSATLANGFTVNQTVDSSVVAPTNNSYVRHWSLGITYRVR